ncbi:hypothetical protein GCM10022289_11300 [Pedobacter jeongneungensis]|uniref:Uncharacterized protein n=1 Tax=Pedobacter jeongneungensis TaxID=947309 RepID=A0ABP8B893_9SPHI
MEINKNGGALEAANRNKFEEGVVETRWTDVGEPYYVIRDGLDLEEYAAMAKAVLESEKDIAHDFTGKVISESGDREVLFEYKSGWFLEGLAEGEIE